MLPQTQPLAPASNHAKIAKLKQFVKESNDAPRKTLHQESLAILAEPELIQLASDALPLLIYVVGTCASTNTAFCDVTQCRLAESLRKSPATLTTWNHHLQKVGLLNAKRRKGCVRFTPDERFGLSTPRPTETPATTQSPLASLLDAVLIDLAKRIQTLDLHESAHGLEVTK